MEEKKELIVNTEEIMREIRKTIMEEEEKTLPTFQSIVMRKRPPEGNLFHSWNYINQNYAVPYGWDLGPRGIKTFIKRIIKRLLKCILLPIVNMQNERNAKFTECINELVIVTNVLAEENKLLRQELRELREEKKL